MLPIALRPIERVSFFLGLSTSLLQLNVVQVARTDASSVAACDLYFKCRWFQSRTDYRQTFP
jgi:hypothetical protein